MVGEFAGGKKHRREKGLDAQEEKNTDGERKSERKSEGKEGAGNSESAESRRYGELAEAIGERIRAVRSAQRLSRAHLARTANLAASHLGEIERGEIAPGSSTLAKVAVGLQVGVGAFFPNVADLALLVGLEVRQRGEEWGEKAGYSSFLGYDEYDKGSEGNRGNRGNQDDEVEGGPAQSRVQTGESAPETKGREGTTNRKVETLLSTAAIAKLAHVEARTLQKWIAQGLVTPPFYIRQEQRPPKHGSERITGQEASLYAAFRLEDLPAIIAVRNRARVRQKGRKGYEEQVSLEAAGD